jgi:hypothetical protein
MIKCGFEEAHPILQEIQNVNHPYRRSAAEGGVIFKEDSLQPSTAFFATLFFCQNALQKIDAYQLTQKQIMLHLPHDQEL